MSRFYASINDGRKSKTCTGHTSIEGHIRGWSIGCRVVVSKTIDDKDLVQVYKTTGSHGNGSDELICEYED